MLYTHSPTLCADDLSATDDSNELEDGDDNEGEKGASPFDQIKEFALSFFDDQGEGGIKIEDYSNAAMERALQFATSFSQAVTSTVLALAKVGDAATTYLVFSGIVLFILSLVGDGRMIKPCEMHSGALEGTGVKEFGIVR